MELYFFIFSCNTFATECNPKKSNLFYTMIFHVGRIFFALDLLYRT